MLESMEQWRKQKATELEEQDRLAAAAATEAEAKAKVKIEQAGDEKASTKKRKRRRKTGVSWSSKTAKRKKPTTIDACDSPQVVMVTDLEATLALATTTTTTMTTTTAMGEKAILKEPKSEPQLFTSLVLQDEDDGEDWYAAQPQVGSEAENDKEEEGEEDSNSVGLRMQLYGEDEPYVVNPHERGNISHFVNVCNPLCTVELPIVFDQICTCVCVCTHIWQHSCHPNLWIVPVVSGLQDLRLAKYASLHCVALCSLAHFLCFFLTMPLQAMLLCRV
jgi:hypothetical protein